MRDATEFILTTVHVLWGKKPADRIGELTAFATWMRGWAGRPNDWNRNLLVLGDFNLDRIDDPTQPDAPSLLDGLTYMGNGGNFDFIPHVLRDLTKSQASWRISDHYPLWLEFVTE